MPETAHGRLKTFEQEFPANTHTMIIVLMSLLPWQVPPLTSQQPLYTSLCKSKYSPHCLAVNLLAGLYSPPPALTRELRQRNYIPRGKVYCQECNYLTLFTFPNVSHELAWKINCNTGEHSWQRGQYYAQCSAHQWQSQLSQCECLLSQKEAAPLLAENKKTVSHTALSYQHLALLE